MKQCNLILPPEDEVKLSLLISGLDLIFLTQRSYLEGKINTFANPAISQILSKASMFVMKWICRHCALNDMIRMAFLICNRILSPSKKKKPKPKTKSKQPPPTKKKHKLNLF